MVSVTMEYALEHSLNIPAVKGLQWLGKDKFIETLAGCDFQQIRERPEETWFIIDPRWLRLQPGRAHRTLYSLCQ